jgi:hypothetical protein
VNIRSPRLIAACLLFALLATGCAQDEQTASSDADVAAASEAIKARSELPSSTPSSPSEEPSVEISVPQQPATLAKNPLYRIGQLPASRCAEPEYEPTSLASVRAYYSELLACMNKAWAPAIHKAGFTFRPPKVVW